MLAGLRPLAGPERRGVRPPGRGARRGSGRPAPRRAGRRPPRRWRRPGALMAPPAWRLDPAARTADAALGLPAQPQRDRQGLHRRAGLRRRAGPAAGRPRALAERRRRPRASAARSPRPSGSPTRGRDSETTEPLALIEVRDRAVATSGSSQRGFRIDGRWYSHIFDPRTGRARRRGRRRDGHRRRGRPTPTPWRRSSTCSRPRRASAWSSTLPGRRVPDRRRRRPDHAERRLAPLRDGAGPWLAGPMPSAVADEASAEERPAARGAAWGEEFELRRQLRDQPPRGRRAALPPALRGHLGRGQGRVPGPQPDPLGLDGGPGPFQWLPDLKRWYKADQARKQVDKTDMVFTIARADPPARQVQGRSGTARTTTASRLPAASTRSASTPPASTGRIRVFELP